MSFTAGHPLPVLHRVDHCFGPQDRVIFRCCAKPIAKHLVPDIIYGIPVGDDPRIDRVVEGSKIAS
jgi:hypothetical protein